MGSPAAASAAATAAGDSAQWLSVKEETIFLHDGLIRVTDLAELPSEIVGVAEPGDTELEVRGGPQLSGVAGRWVLGVGSLLAPRPVGFIANNGESGAGQEDGGDEDGG